MLFPRSPNTDGTLCGQRGRAGSLLDFFPSTHFYNMMAAEVSSEDTGSVTAGTGVAGGAGGPEPAPFHYFPKPSRVGVTNLGTTPGLHQHSNTSPDSAPDMNMIYPPPGGDVTGPVLSATGSGGTVGGLSGFQGINSGMVGVVCSSPTGTEVPASRFSPTPKGPDSPTVFPPLPPPPPPPAGCGGLGVTMDESDMQDGPEIEEEEVEFPLSAPPSNQ